MSSLVAFDAVARLNSVTLAAETLNTSQSAVSRHIRNLEGSLGVQLFHREGRGISLTDGGRIYHDAVTAALSGLQTAESRLLHNSKSLTIACSYSVSHLIILPQYSRLRRLLGEDVPIRVLTSNYEAQAAMDEVNADIIIGYKYDGPSKQCQRIMLEDVIPVAAPDYIAEHRDILEGPPEGWNRLRLLDLAHSPGSWVLWADWFAHHGVEMTKEPEERFSNYVYLLESAIAGAGVALGWRGFFERHQKAGSLEVIGQSWLSTDNYLFAWCTRRGQYKSSAQACMRLLAGLSGASAEGHAP